MKLAWYFLVGSLVSGCFSYASGSEAAPDCESASAVLRSGIEAQPGDVLVLFLDALQTNPGCRRQLITTAIEVSNADADLLTRIVYIARRELPGEDTLIAETVMSAAPELAPVVRDAFMKSPEEMEAALANGSSAEREIPAEAREMDREISEAIARMTARIEGDLSERQEIIVNQVQFKHHDEIRVSGSSQPVDEATLVNSFPVDKEDERELVPAPATIDDLWAPSDTIRLEDEVFHPADGSSTRPLEARQRRIAPAGMVGIPLRPKLGSSSVYYIPPSGEDFESTMDHDDEAAPRPKLIIRSAPATPTSPM